MTKRERRPRVTDIEIDAMAMACSFLGRTISDYQTAAAAHTAYWSDDKEKRIRDLRWAAGVLRDVAKQIERRANDLRYKW